MTPWIRAVVCGVLVLLVVVPGPARAEESRVDRIRAAVAGTGVYLEPGTAMGELELWTRRLEVAVARSRLAVPVRVALWTPVPGLPSTEEQYAEAPDQLAKQLGLDGGIAITSLGMEAMVDYDTVTGDSLRHAQALDDQTEAVAEELIAAAGNQERYQSLSPVARAWIWLRLAGEQDPRPRELVAELSGDVSLFIDGAPPPDLHRLYAEEDDGGIHPVALVVAVLTLLATASVFLLRWRRDEAQRVGVQEPLTRSESAGRLTDLQLEQEVTELAEAIARSEVPPGERAHDRAQAYLDAAERYVDSPLDRDRVGCHLLARDGLLVLQGGTLTARCFFHPEHLAEASVGKGKVRVPCCLRCARAVRKGERPPALVVADADGELAPYFDTHDVWTTTGYGSLPGNWAKRALLTSLRAAVGR